jgi:hypothetical protein
MWAIEKGPKGEGVIIFYDFGMMNSFERRLVDFFFAVYCTYLYIGTVLSLPTNVDFCVLGLLFHRWYREIAEPAL